MGGKKRKAALRVRTPLTPDQQADIARLVRAISFGGGRCFYRAVVGQAARFWRSADALTRPWRPTGTPALGDAWYCPAPQHVGTITTQLRDAREDIMELTRSKVTQLTAAWRQGETPVFRQQLIVF